MNSKLVILAGGKPMVLTDDFSISVELQNPLFNDTEMFSYPVSLPLDGNRHFLKNPDDIHSDIRPVDYEHTPHANYCRRHSVGKWHSCDARGRRSERRALSEY